MCCNYHNICAYISVSICPAMNVIHLLNEFSNVYSFIIKLLYTTIYPQYIYCHKHRKDITNEAMGTKVLGRKHRPCAPLVPMSMIVHVHMQVYNIVMKVDSPQYWG